MLYGCRLRGRGRGRGAAWSFVIAQGYSAKILSDAVLYSCTVFSRRQCWFARRIILGLHRGFLLTSHFPERVSQNMEHAYRLAFPARAQVCARQNHPPYSRIAHRHDGASGQRVEHLATCVNCRKKTGQRGARDLRAVGAPPGAMRSAPPMRTGSTASGVRIIGNSRGALPRV